MSYPGLYDQLPTQRFATAFCGRAAACNYHGVRIARLLPSRWACARSTSCHSWHGRWRAKPPAPSAGLPAGLLPIFWPRSTRTEVAMAAELTFAEARRAVVAALERAADTLKRLPMPRNGMPARERSSWPAIPDDPDEDCDRAPSRPHMTPPGRGQFPNSIGCCRGWERSTAKNVGLPGPARRGCHGLASHVSLASPSGRCATYGPARSIASSQPPCMMRRRAIPLRCHTVGLAKCIALRVDVPGSYTTLA